MPGRTDATRPLSAVGFTRLLERLDPDRDRAANEYERLRQALVRFFDWRGAWPPEECADETIDRLAQKLEQDTRVDNLRSYAHGIARMLLLERRRGPSFDPLEQDSAVAGAPPVDDDDRLHECLDGCLAGLPVESRSLVLDYYAGDGAAKISNRRRLAIALRLSESALRSRVQRVRDTLEACVENCLAALGDDQ